MQDVTNFFYYDTFVKNGLPQIIWEFGDNVKPDWIHVTAFPESKKMVGGLRWNEKKITRAIRENGKTKYIPFDL